MSKKTTEAKRFIPVFRNHYNTVPAKGEVNKDPSLTVPDQSMSLREIMYKYAHGLPLGGSNEVPVYNGDIDLPDFKRMDISEIQDYIVEQRKIIKEYEDAQIAAHKAKAEKEMEEFYRKKFAAEPKPEAPAPAPAPTEEPKSE